MEKLVGDDCFRALDLKSYVLFYFTANWCKPCQTASPMMDNLMIEYNNKNINFFKIDIDEDDNSEICQKCDVKQVPVFLLFKDRNFVDKVLGGNQQEIKNMIDSNLNNVVSNELFNKQNLQKQPENKEFFPSNSFQGEYQGYVFKTDYNGLGYYLDKK